MNDYIPITGDATEILKAYAKMGQGLNQEFEGLADYCENSNGHGGCLINTADGCSMLNCPLPKG